MVNEFVRITNTGPENLIIAHFIKGAVHEVYFPQTILKPGEFYEYTLTGPNDILMVSEVLLDQNVTDLINTADSLGMSNTTVDVSDDTLDDPTKVLKWDNGRLMIDLTTDAMALAEQNVQDAQAATTIDASASGGALIALPIGNITPNVTPNNTNTIIGLF